MSAFAGLHSFSPLADDTDARLAAATRVFARTAPDGHADARRQHVAMTFSAFHITAESRRASQPFAHGPLLVTWDGRLDNRRELADRLDGVDAARTTDVELVTRSFEGVDSPSERGAAAVGRFLGDFAVASWDARAERLVLARDAMGARPIFYCREGETLLWATTLDGLLALRSTPPEIDEDWLGAHLLRLVPSDATPYRGISIVPAGHRLVVDRSGSRLEEFWTLGRHPEIRYRSDAEYEEHFREVFFEAVRVRLRTGGAPACAELSGGLDSSSVACVADQILRTESVEASDLLTYSIVYDRASTADEREFIAEAERRIGRTHLHLLEDDHPMLAPDFHQPWAEIPYFLQTLRAPHVYAGQRLAETGTRLVMTGAGGDQLLWNDVEAPYYLADLAKAGRLADLWRELGAWRRRPARSSYPQPLPQLILRGLVQPVLASSRGRSRFPAYGQSLFGSLDQRLGARMHEIWRNNHRPLPGIRPSRLPPVEELRDVAMHIGWFYQFERLGFQMTHPFLHRPLVELCLGVPNDQHVRVDQTRSLQRRALRDILPAKIAARKTKVGPDEAILRGIRREWQTIEALLDGSRAVERGLVEADAVRAALVRASGGYAPYNMDLVRFLEVEIWLRAQEGHKLTSASAAASGATAEQRAPRLPARAEGVARPTPTPHARENDPRENAACRPSASSAA